MKTGLLSMLLGLTLCACGGGGSDGGGGSSPAPTSADVSVTSSPPAGGLSAGGNGTFTVIVSNAGPDASGPVAVNLSRTSGLTLGSVTCAAAGGATCPASLGASMQAAGMPRSGVLTFSVQISASLFVSASGTEALSTTISAANDSQVANNAVTVNVAFPGVDARNGTYQVYSSNGRQYTLQINFADQVLVMQGEGFQRQASFTADASGGGFTIASNERFRVAQDMVIGNFNFGAGGLPYLAARSFVSSTAELSGDLNALTRVLPTTGGADSRIFAMQWSGTNLRICTDNIIYTASACPSASLRTYALTVNGTEFTGFDAAHSDTIKFRVARSGTYQVYMRSELVSDGTARRFTLALPNAAGLTAGNYVGGATVGWWGVAAWTPTSYGFSGVDGAGLPVSDSVSSFSALPASGPTGIRGGTRTSDSAYVFAMQSPVLSVLVGARGGAAAGYMQIGTP